MKALRMLQKWNNVNYPSKQEINEAIAELEALENDLKDLITVASDEDLTAHDIMNELQKYFEKIQRLLNETD